MQRKILHVTFAIGLAASLQACMRPEEVSPSYLGMAMASEDVTSDQMTATERANRRELRHVTSNKVLSAMAFQKTTGRAIDPARLQGVR